MHKTLLVALISVIVAVSCTKSPAPTASSGVDFARIKAANADEWLAHGRTYDEQRYSPLNQINQSNVKQLGLAWFADLDTKRGQEATPLVIDGKIFISTAWSKAKAYDAVTGKLLWEYDPKVPGERAVDACCDVVNRGMAAYGNNLYLGTLDGRLVALDRNTGKEVWSVVTVDQSKPYTITGAPRVINGLVIIGNGGAEMGVRGYITAYDAASGKQAWRFFTVPGAPGTNTEAYLKAAESTWKGDWVKYGGGGTVWDSMAYDPELDLLYIGVGNGSPWNQFYRSAGEGDNLYLSSIIALRPKTGEYVWHFQTTPGESWDYTATQHIILADLKIDGQQRKVLMQAPKNGFFFVLDRVNGKLISAQNYVDVNWATGFDLKTGRPIENPDSRFYKTGKPWLGSPGPIGAHNWQPMSFDVNTGLVYIPVLRTAFPYIHDPAWKPVKQGFNIGLGLPVSNAPPDPKMIADMVASTTGELVAWDPVAQKARWRVPYKLPWNGGLLSTGGNLLFQGNSMSEFTAYDPRTGTKLWSFPTQTGVLAPAVTYRVKGEQFVAVVVGWGGAVPISFGATSEAYGPIPNVSRLLVFKLGGTAKLPERFPDSVAPLDPPPLNAKPEQTAIGALKYAQSCSVCHGAAAAGVSVTRDLRRAASLKDATLWRKIVMDGILSANGMVGWKDQITDEESENIRQYVIKRAHEDKALEKLMQRQ